MSSVATIRYLVSRFVSFASKGFLVRGLRPPYYALALSGKDANESMNHAIGMRLMIMAGTPSKRPRFMYICVELNPAASSCNV
jgi:hypothetical protein